VCIVACCGLRQHLQQRFPIGQVPIRAIVDCTQLCTFLPFQLLNPRFWAPLQPNLILSAVKPKPVLVWHGAGMFLHDAPAAWQHNSNCAGQPAACRFASMQTLLAA
jgi:hypothetical protein